MPRNDRESSNGNGRGRHFGIGSFEQQQFERNRGPEVERSAPETVGRDEAERERQRYDRRHGTFARSHDDREDRREQFGQRGDADDHSGRWYGRSDRDDRSRFGMRREETRDYRRDDDDDRDRSWFDRARDNVRGWFNRDEQLDDDRPRDRGQGYMNERDARRRYHMDDDDRHGDHQVFGGRGLSAHDDPYEVRRDEQRRFGTREEPYAQRSMGRDDLRLGPRYRAENMPGDDRYRQEQRFREMNQRDQRHRFTDTDDDQRRNWAAWSGRSDRNHDYQRDHSRDLFSRDERYPQSYDDRYGHSSIRGNRLDYDQQFVSRADHHDDDRASGVRGRDEDQDRSFVPRDEYGRRRRR